MHARFGIPQYIQCTHHGLTVSHFFFKGVDLHSAMAFLRLKCVFSVEAGLIAEALLLLFFVCIAVKQAECS